MEKTEVTKNATWARSCSTCQHCGALGVGGREITLICRAHPPRVETVVVPKSATELEIKTVTMWPEVKKTDWCGEYVADKGSVPKGESVQ